TLKGEAKTEWDTEWKIYKTRIESIEKHRGQAFNMIKGQCTLALMEQMKCDSEYTRCIASNDPLRLKSLIERTIITQSDNKYVFATLYEQEVGLFGFQQNKLTEDQWHERFNTKVSIGDTLGVSRDHTMALNYVAKERFNKEFDDLNDDDERESVRSDAQERYLAYIFLRQSGPQHEKLKTDLGDAFTVAGDSTTRARIYPKTRDEVYGQLQRYHKVKRTTVTSEGSSFVQGGRGRGSGRAGRTSGRFDKEYWADKKCHKCDKLGHPASACKKKDADDKSTGSNKSKSSKSSRSSAKQALEKVRKMQKEWKKQKKSFATLEAQLEEDANQSDLTDSDDEEGETSHFQHHTFLTKHAQIHNTMLDDRKLNMRQVILLDNESTMDLFCNKCFVTGVAKS
ncbi:MAG: hypothetical protein ACRCZI_15505, partial [Cetobacterium sp.]